MANGYTDKVVMKIGGSLIVPNGGIDTDFLSKLNSFIREQLSGGARQFFLVAGGGATARHYRDAGRGVIGYELTSDDLDWLGIHATKLNAHLIRTIFRDIAHPYVIKHYEIIRKASEPVVVAAGWKPGWSADYSTALICEDYGAKTIVKLSNIKRVYDKDPNKFKDAKPIRKISWSKFRKIVGDKWIPGMHVPFDPIASKKAEELGLKVVILKGDDFDNLKKYFRNEEFVGTVIE